ncbi:MAG: four helix bundle protein [Sediminibacterium sp. Gen4]|jgi:four helix bundle protein|uniref:four helix bundle protein n=1 Tax=unclassified Sediminibacterium TaxID=2635961 RepID=UPI0015BDD511|nr:MULTISPECIES: four helix bundle protein [unclassified Sediminibacterium]MBW0162745.1 four helix bundle protein [Sediminibacterium sp.]MBW0164853.1 four helix bundle protein [Sediminibacterium sp.]NWK65659.1 four helix bundle protein [Sediminibacterium sp. Gen4]
MDRVTLQKRTKNFHLSIIELCKHLPYNSIGFEVGKQLIRSAGSVGANYRASVRAKSQADFIYKIEIVLEEADESLYWLEIIQESNLSSFPKITQLIQEAKELTAIFAATDKTLKAKNKNNKLDIRHQK